MRVVLPQLCGQGVPRRTLTERSEHTGAGRSSCCLTCANWAVALHLSGGYTPLRGAILVSLLAHGCANECLTSSSRAPLGLCPAHGVGLRRRRQCAVPAHAAAGTGVQPEPWPQPAPAAGDPAGWWVWSPAGCQSTLTAGCQPALAAALQPAPTTSLRSAAIRAQFRRHRFLGVHLRRIRGAWHLGRPDVPGDSHHALARSRQLSPAACGLACRAKPQTAVKGLPVFRPPGSSLQSPAAPRILVEGAHGRNWNEGRHAYARATAGSGRVDPGSGLGIPHWRRRPGGQRAAAGLRRDAPGAH